MTPEEIEKWVEVSWTRVRRMKKAWTQIDALLATLATLRDDKLFELSVSETMESLNEQAHALRAEFRNLEAELLDSLKENAAVLPLVVIRSVCDLIAHL